MNKADSDFLEHLFKENNILRASVTSLKRQLHNVTTNMEETETELKLLKVKVEEHHLEKQETVQHAQQFVKQATESLINPTRKDTEESKFTNERHEAEIFLMSEELHKIRHDLTIEVEKRVAAESQLEKVSLDLKDLKMYTEKEDLIRKQEQTEPDVDLAELKVVLAQAQKKSDEYKTRMLDFVNEANHVQNSQQNQLQGVEALIEGVRDEYEEFISITRLEHDTFQTRQKLEYNALKEEFESHKNKTFEEKKQTMMDYQNILSSMQTQFDEYRTTTELLFNVEMAKLDEEITSQAARYEQEVMYVIQAKDKFYLDMMVTKDAKIMGLIEGSDLQSVMQKHELDMENMRKEHAKDVENVKSDHESESKNVILLLQRQNVSLESKTEKLQSHLKLIEIRMKELMNTIDQKNKDITDRDEIRSKVESEFQKKITELNEKMTKLGQEKERLRHKVIRLNLHAKGEGGNSMENMIKRLSNDAAILRIEFEDLGMKYNATLEENLGISRKLREKQKLCGFLEKEVERRGHEFKEMTTTFEDFLAGRAKQARKDRNEKLLQHVLSQEKIKKDLIEEPIIPIVGTPNVLIRSIVPDRGHNIKDAEMKNTVTLERGQAYLKRFKNLSKAFVRSMANLEQPGEAASGPWQKIPLYSKLDDTSLALAKLYQESPIQTSDNTSKSSVYKHNTGVVEKSGAKLYKGDVRDGSIPAGISRKPSTATKTSVQESLRIGY